MKNSSHTHRQLVQEYRVSYDSITHGLQSLGEIIKLGMNTQLDMAMFSLFKQKKDKLLLQVHKYTNY